MSRPKVIDWSTPEKLEAGLAQAMSAVEQGADPLDALAAQAEIDPILAYRYADGAGGYGHFCPKCAESTRRQLPPSMRDDHAVRVSDLEGAREQVRCEKCSALIYRGVA